LDALERRSDLFDVQQVGDDHLGAEVPQLRGPLVLHAHDRANVVAELEQFLRHGPAGPALLNTPDRRVFVPASLARSTGDKDRFHVFRSITG